jgi:hypothetical protein
MNKKYNHIAIFGPLASLKLILYDIANIIPTKKILILHYKYHILALKRLRFSFVYKF